MPEPLPGQLLEVRISEKACRRRLFLAWSIRRFRVPMRHVLGPDGRLLLDPEIENGDYFSVSLRRGALTLRTGGYVGYIPINDRIIVNVRPRFRLPT